MNLQPKKRGRTLQAPDGGRGNGYAASPPALAQLGPAYTAGPRPQKQALLRGHVLHQHGQHVQIVDRLAGRQ